MTSSPDFDPIAEAQARVRLRYLRARPIRPVGKPIGALAQTLARRVLADKASGIERLKLRWGDIVGESLARYCRPEKFTTTKDGRMLVLRVVPAAAPMVQHQSELIRQRVSIAAGGTITRLKMVQGPLHGAATGPDPRRTPRVLEPAEAARLEADAAPIANPRLRAAIVGLGKAVLSRE